MEGEGETGGKEGMERCWRERGDGGREGGGRDRRERGDGERGEREMLEGKRGGIEGVLYNAHINIYTSIIPLGSTIAETHSRYSSVHSTVPTCKCRIVSCSPLLTSQI